MGRAGHAGRERLGAEALGGEDLGKVGPGLE